mgnify:CR=1 FL=1
MLKIISNKKKYCIFDIGTDKVVCLFFKVQNNKPFILGMNHQKSIGFLNNNKIDSNKLSATIHHALEKALPKNSKLNEYQFFCNITDTKSLTKKQFSEIDSRRLEITKKDVRRVFKKSLIESKVRGKYLLHSYPINFRINNDKIIDNPVGEKCEKFGIMLFNVYADYELYKIINNCFKDQGINVKSFFDTGIASSMANITPSEKKGGVACIDIGAKTSKVTVFINDKIVFTNIIPIGGEHVTNDISKGIDISRESAEHAKIIYGTLSLPFNEKIEVKSNNSRSKLISKNLLYGVIKPRYEEIFEIIRDNIFDDIYARVSIKDLVITGGASKIFGLSNIAESIFNRKVRLGTIKNKESFFYNKPEFSTLLGLIKLAQNNKEHEYSDILTKNNFITAFDKIENWIEESYA